MKEIIDILKLEMISKPLYETSKGTLRLCLRKGENVEFLTLDSVPLEVDINNQILKLINESK